MAEQNAKEIRVFAEGDLYVAPFGTELPAKDDPDEPLDPAYVNLGLTSDDGVTFNNGTEVEDIMSWQSQTPSLKIVTGRSYTVAAQLQQHNRDNFGIAFGGGEWTEPEPGVNRYDPPGDADPLAEYVVVVEGLVGEVRGRVVIKRATVEGEVETQFVRNAPSLLPVTFAALTPSGEDKPWYFVSNDEAYAVSS